MMNRWKGPHALCCALAIATPSCGANTPTPAQQASVGAYAAALQVCIGVAKATDGGLARYEQCAHVVDVTAGLADGGS